MMSPSTAGSSRCFEATDQGRVSIVLPRRFRYSRAAGLRSDSVRPQPRCLPFPPFRPIVAGGTSSTAPTSSNGTRDDPGVGAAAHWLTLAGLERARHLRSARSRLLGGERSPQRRSELRRFVVASIAGTTMTPINWSDGTDFEEPRGLAARPRPLAQPVRQRARELVQLLQCHELVASMGEQRVARTIVGGGNSEFTERRDVGPSDLSPR